MLPLASKCEEYYNIISEHQKAPGGPLTTNDGEEKERFLLTKANMMSEPSQPCSLSSPAHPMKGGRRGGQGTGTSRTNIINNSLDKFEGDILGALTARNAHARHFYGNLPCVFSFAVTSIFAGWNRSPVGQCQSLRHCRVDFAPAYIHLFDL